MPRKAPPIPGTASPSRFTLRGFPLAEVLTGLAFLVGWCLVTFAVASLTVPQVWPLSIGLLLLSAGGWRMLVGLATDGLYALTRPKPELKRGPDA